MPKLITASATIEISPFKREKPKSNWIETILAIDYHLPNQTTRLELPSNGVSIQSEDFNRLINGVQEYIRSLPIHPVTMDQHIAPYHFSPTEIGFQIEFGYGFYFEEHRKNGKISIDFKMGLRAFGSEALSGHYIGCTTSTEIKTVQRFLDELERELIGILTKT